MESIVIICFNTYFDHNIIQAPANIRQKIICIILFICMDIIRLHSQVNLRSEKCFLTTVHIYISLILYTWSVLGYNKANFNMVNVPLNICMLCKCYPFFFLRLVYSFSWCNPFFCNKIFSPSQEMLSLSNILLRIKALSPLKPTRHTRGY